jgi:hypothetical protein
MPCGTWSVQWSWILEIMISFSGPGSLIFAHATISELGRLLIAALLSREKTIMRGWPLSGSTSMNKLIPVHGMRFSTKFSPRILHRREI